MRHLKDHLQCDQIGLFLKVLANIFCSKIAQIFGDFLGYIEKRQILIQNCFDYFWGNLWRN